MNKIFVPSVLALGSAMTNIIVYSAVGVILLIAIILLRFNHRMQTKSAIYMDNETGVYNRKGIIKYVERKGKGFSKPTILEVQVENLGFLYSSTTKRMTLMHSLADLLLSGLSPIETIGRVEFDKFLVLYDGKSHDEIKQICNEIYKKFNEKNLENYGKYVFYLRFGVYEDVKFDNPEEVINASLGIITYSNLQDGFIYYYGEEVKRKFELLQVMNEQKDAAYDEGRIISYVQPKVDLKTGKVVGGELLARWVDSNGEPLYSPADFIPLFEGNGFVNKVEKLMFENACKLSQLLEARGKKDLVISVNISKVQFNQPDFEQSLLETVNKYGIPPKNIQIEITETAVSENYQHFSNCIMKLRSLGFTVAMDDFGKDYSSLGSLSDNPFDVIKLDMVFFKDKLATDKSKAIVKELCDLLKSLNISVVCEGIEDKETLDVLATLTQDVLIQGYCISKPIPINQYEAFVDTTFDFNYAPIVAAPKAIQQATTTTTTEGGTTININTPAQQQPQANAEMEELKRQLADVNRLLTKNIEDQRREKEEAEKRKLQEQIEELKRAQEKPQQNSELERLRMEFEMMKRSQQQPTDPRDEEIARMRAEMDAMRNGNYQSRDSRDYEMERMRRELEDMRRSNSYRKDPRDEELQRMRDELEAIRREQREAEEDAKNDELRRMREELAAIKNDNKVTNRENEELVKMREELEAMKNDRNNSQAESAEIAKLREELNATINQTTLEHQKELAEQKKVQAALQDELDKTKKENADLEAIINEILASEEKEEAEYHELSENEIEEKQKEADESLNLDIDENDDNEADDVEEDDEIDDLEAPKPEKSLEEIEKMFVDFKDQFGDEWLDKAKAELKDAYYEAINGIKYYKGNVKLDFQARMKAASPEVKKLFNIVKNEFMQYEGVTNKTLSSYDCFYMGKTMIGKVAITKSKVRVYLAVDPASFNDRQFPHKDVSSKKIHQRTPFYMLCKSGLSIKRFKNVLSSQMLDLNAKLNEDYKPVDYAIKFRFMKSK